MCHLIKYLAAGPLRFVTSHSRFALASMRNRGKNEVPGEEAELAVNQIPSCIKKTGFELLLSFVISLLLFFHLINVTLFPHALVKN